METIRVWDWMETTRVWDGIKTRHPLLGNVSSVKAGLHVYVEINESTPPPLPKERTHTCSIDRSLYQVGRCGYEQFD